MRNHRVTLTDHQRLLYPVLFILQYSDDWCFTFGACTCHRRCRTVGHHTLVPSLFCVDIDNLSAVVTNRQPTQGAPPTSASRFASHAQFGCANHHVTDTARRNDASAFHFRLCRLRGTYSIMTEGIYVVFKLKWHCVVRNAGVCRWIFDKRRGPKD